MATQTTELAALQRPETEETAIRSAAAGVPLRAHLVWLGAQFPWVNVLSVRSAALRGGFDEVVLHHDSDLSATPYFAELVNTPRLVLRRLDVQSLLARCKPYGSQLQETYDGLRTPATRSDLLRYALLYDEGGVYLDMDTVTVHSLEPLCRGVRTFCGEERLVYPARVRFSGNPLIRAGALARAVLRDILRRVPAGWATFRRLESWYPRGANPAVIGSAPRSPFLHHLMEQLVAMPADQRWRPCAIGPHLLQRCVESYVGADLVVHPPTVFFPLGPEISQHWFRKTPHVDLARVLGDAVVVHWYASVRSRDITPHIDPEYVVRNQSSQLFSKLALPYAREGGGSKGQ